jgi:hypothetical protein
LVDSWEAEYRGISPGLAMTPKDRPMILAKLEEFLRKRFAKIYSKRLANELSTFIVKDTKPQAVKGSNDDLIMCHAIAIWVRDVCPEFRSSSIASDIMMMFKATQKNSTDFTGISSPSARIEQQKQKIKKIVESQYQPVVMNPYGKLIYRG